MCDMWLATIYCDDGRVERYYFAKQSDMLQSFRNTWSKCEDVTIHHDVMGGIHVLDSGRLTLGIGRKFNHRDILTGPTHF